MAKQQFEVGQLVNVSGEVKWGDSFYRVSTRGVIEEVRPRSCLVTLENVDGDYGVTLSVKNMFLEKEGNHH